MIDAGTLLAATLLLPLGMLAACLSRRVRERMPSLLAVAPLPALAAALWAVDGPLLALPPALLRLTLALDLPGAMLLGTAALLWSAAGAAAATHLRDKPDRGRFAVWWLLTLTGNLGIFLAADLASFYPFYALVSLSAYGLVSYDGTARVRRAGAVYVALALLGEAVLLMGFVLLAAGSADGSLAIRDVVAALPTSPWRDATLALLIAGLGIKLGLVPLHVWMPLAYSAAPFPAAAVMSGAAVKAGVIGLIRFLPFGVAQPEWGGALAAAGLLGAFYGVAVGITQRNPKTVLAYSSVSQMGLLAAVLGMGLAAGDAGVALVASFYAAHHVLVKGGLFLALGAVTGRSARRPWPVAGPAAVLALALAGLPLTGGALAKWAVKGPLGEGTVGLLATLSAAGSTLLMLHFLHALVTTAASDGDSPPRARAVAPWLLTALAAVAVPFVLFPRLGLGPVADVFVPAALWKALWPILIGASLALALRRFGHALPRVPEGDVASLAERAGPSLRRWAAAFERADGALRQWPVAGISFLLVTVLLGAVLLTRH